MVSASEGTCEGLGMLWSPRTMYAEREPEGGKGKGRVEDTGKLYTQGFKMRGG